MRKVEEFEYNILEYKKYASTTDQFSTHMYENKGDGIHSRSDGKSRRMEGNTTHNLESGQVNLDATEGSWVFIPRRNSEGGPNESTSRST